MVELPDVCDTVSRLKRRQISPREATGAAVERIEALNQKLNAVVWARFEAALDEADQVDLDTPLAGLPILLKDVALEGAPFHDGNRVMGEIGWHFPCTDLFTQRLLDAGAIMLGYTNIPEFTSAATTESRWHGPCRNPWDPQRSSGGSSGGAGAAVASGMVAATQSSDGGGSSRIPASANGLFTIKPSRGRTPLGPSSASWLDISNSLGFETHSVADFATLLDLVAGPDPHETLCAPPASRRFVDEVGADPGRLRIGFTTAGGGSTAPCHPESQLAAERAAALLADLGHEVGESAPPPFLFEESFAIILGYWPAKVALRAARIEDAIGRSLGEADLEPATFGMLQKARGRSAADFILALDSIRDFSRRAPCWWRSHDLLLTPMTGSPPPPLGVMNGTDPAGRAMSALWGRYAPYANITGQPAASLPLHWTRDGLPIGVQLIADSGREDVLLRVSAQIEEAAPWRGRMPPIRAI